jgi:hypothetical protein
MTKYEFNNLKVGEFIPVLSKDKESFFRYQVLEINRTKGTIRTILQNKHYSYKSQLCRYKSMEGRTCLGEAGVSPPYEIIEKIV